MTLDQPGMQWLVQNFPQDVPHGDRQTGWFLQFFGYSWKPYRIPIPIPLEFKRATSTMKQLQDKWHMLAPEQEQFQQRIKASIGD
jgi:hypothetical protein